MGFDTPTVRPSPPPSSSLGGGGVTLCSSNTTGTSASGTEGQAGAMDFTGRESTNYNDHNAYANNNVTPCNLSSRQGPTDDLETKSWKYVNTLLSLTPFTPATEATTPMSSFGPTPIMSTPRHYASSSGPSVETTATTTTPAPSVVVEESFCEDNKENSFLPATETPETKWRVRALFQDGESSDDSPKYDQHRDQAAVREEQKHGNDNDEYRLIRTTAQPGLNIHTNISSLATTTANSISTPTCLSRSNSVIRTRRASSQYTNDNISDTTTSVSLFGISERRRTSQGRSGTPPASGRVVTHVDSNNGVNGVLENNNSNEPCPELLLQATPEQKSRNYRRSSLSVVPDQSGNFFDFIRKIPNAIITTSKDIVTVSKHLLCRPRIDTLFVWLICSLAFCSVFLLYKTNRSVMLDDITLTDRLSPMPIRQATPYHAYLFHSHENPTSLLLQQRQQPPFRPAGGLRGELLQTIALTATQEDDKGHRRDTQTATDEKKKKKKDSHKKTKKHGHKDKKVGTKKKPVKKVTKEPKLPTLKDAFNMTLPSNWKKGKKRTFNKQDSKMYLGRGPTSSETSTDKTKESNQGNKKFSERVVILHDSITSISSPAKDSGAKSRGMRKIELYPAEFTDNTQYYSMLDSGDERLQAMELREPYAVGECVPMQDWQTTFNPSCNGMHELGLEYLGENTADMNVKLFGTKGYWRNAWKYDSFIGHSHKNERDTVVLKTLKFQHTFEDAHFEHDRVDAVAMERLTSSPHVVNVFGFCGHSVLTEYADGKRLGELADKSRSKPLARLRIARDIANGLADVHGIDGDGNSTFVHLDINPANVLSIGGTLKLNDFNIGIIRRWNTTSNKPCGFPAQYPNPQWRSPEEARNEDNLTEKVDIFSLGHIFFRLICGHEPWNKLEPEGRPSKEEVNEKVQKGILPYIPEDIMNSKDQEVSVIREVMLDCYKYDPDQRPAARDIANSLTKALDELSAKSKSKQ